MVSRPLAFGPSVCRFIRFPFDGVLPCGPATVDRVLAVRLLLVRCPSVVVSCCGEFSLHGEVSRSGYIPYSRVTHASSLRCNRHIGICFTHDTCTEWKTFAVSDRVLLGHERIGWRDLPTANVRCAPDEAATLRDGVRLLVEVTRRAVEAGRSGRRQRATVR